MRSGPGSSSSAASATAEPPAQPLNAGCPGADIEVVSGDVTTVIRPAAVVPEAAANAVLRALESLDVSKGGVWNASATVWQRYSSPWNGPGCTRGSAELVGTIAVAYEMPVRHHITIYRVTVTEVGIE